jgi:hypothetical protein
MPFMTILLLLSVLSLTAIFFYPKERVVGGLRGGPVAPGETAYREDYTCTGFAFDFCPSWPDYGCDRLCFGMVAGRICSLESYDVNEGISREQAACQESAMHLWGFPGD